MHLPLRAPLVVVITLHAAFLLGCGLFKPIDTEDEDDDEDDWFDDHGDDSAGSTDDTDDTDDTGDTGDSGGQDSGGDGPWRSFEGLLTYEHTLDGAALCDFDVRLESTSAYTGDCEGCEFAFYVDGDVTRDDGAAACDPHPVYAFLEDDTYPEMVLAFASTWSSDQGDYVDALLNGYSFYLEGYGEYPGPYWTVLAYDGGYGAASLSGDRLTWEFSYEAPTYSYAYYQDCGSVDFGYAYESLASTRAGADDVDPDAADGDVWTFTGRAGDAVYVSVDTVASGSAFDPWVWLNGPDQCTAVKADDDFDCTYAPPEYSCPSLEHTLDQSGTWQIVVAATGYSAAGSTAAYALYVDGPSGVRLTGDDIEVFAATSSGTETYRFTLEGTLSR